MRASVAGCSVLVLVVVGGAVAPEIEAMATDGLYGWHIIFICRLLRV